MEIILVVMIISLLATVALPNASKLLDTARLDYEVKIFLSKLYYVKALNGTAKANPEIFSSLTELKDCGHKLQINVDEEFSRYSVVSNGKIMSEVHQLPAGFSIFCESGMSNQIFPDESNKGHVRIISKYKVNRYVIPDSVGRWRGDMNPPK